MHREYTGTLKELSVKDNFRVGKKTSLVPLTLGAEATRTVLNVKDLTLLSKALLIPTVVLSPAPPKHKLLSCKQVTKELIRNYRRNKEMENELQVTSVVDTCSRSSSEL
jgi:hypothetical protein